MGRVDIFPTTVMDYQCHSTNYMTGQNCLTMEIW
jgi:hypothetical protein